MKNRYTILGDTVILYLETRSGETYECLVDKEDIPLIEGYKWFYTQGYAKNNKGDPIHKLLVGTDISTRVDHMDRNKLNNRRSNIRRTTVSGNTSNVGIRKDNTTGIRGVSIDKKIVGPNKYRAGIRHNGKRIHLGMFSDKYEAGRAVNRALLLYHGTHSAMRESIKIPSTL